MAEFIYKSLSRGHTEYRLQEEYKKSHTLLKYKNNDINNEEYGLQVKEYKKKVTRYLKHQKKQKEKTASSKLVGVKWCDIHKDWYIKA